MMATKLTAVGAAAGVLAMIWWRRCSETNRKKVRCECQKADCQGIDFGTADNVVLLTPCTLDDVNIRKAVVSPDCGAVAVFAGTTRNSFEEKRVISLNYEAYEGMARKEMLAICTEIRRRWQVGRIAIVHRTGNVAVGKTSVLIGIASCHRHEALQAVAFTIDTLKARVPIWKKELLDEGGHWKHNAEFDSTRITHKTEARSIPVV